MTRGKLIAAVAFVLVAALLLLLAGGGVWLLRSEGGTAALLSRLPGLQTSGLRGSLSGGPFAADRLVFQAGDRTITLENVAWDDARWAWRPHAGVAATWAGLQLSGARAARVVVSAGAAPASAGAPPQPPASLRLPIALALPDLRIARLEMPGQPALSDLRAKVELGAGAGALHRFDDIAFNWDRLQADGRLQIASDAPFALEVDAQARSATGLQPAWQAKAQARGPLDNFKLQLQLGSERTVAARLSADARLQPFAAWPIGALNASLEALDLASLGSGLPQTALSGRAQIDSSGLDAPVSARITLANAAPGRWDEQRLPIATLEAEVAGQPRDRSRIALRRLMVQFAQASGNAGRIEGTGSWQGNSAQMELQLQALRPAALDARAPAMLLGGIAKLSLDGLPSPGGGAAAAASAPSTTPSTSASTAPTAPGQRLQASLALDGRFDERPSLPVQLRGEARGERAGAQWRVELTDLRLQGGGARAQAGVIAALDDAGVLSVQSRGEVNAIDPALWWPGAVGAAPATAGAANVGSAASPANQAWRRGPHRLGGRWQVDLRRPAHPPPPTAAATAAAKSAASPTAGAATALPTLASAWRGQASFDLADSLLAGVPLQGSLRLDSQAAPGWTVEADLRPAGNRAQLRGRIGTLAAEDRWAVTADLPALTALQPWLALQPGLAAALRAPAPAAARAEATAAALPILGGRLAGEIEIKGRWPDAALSGRLEADSLQLGRWRAGRLALRAQASAALQAPVLLQVDGERLSMDDRPIDALQARIEGTLAQHRISLDLHSPLRPPAWAGLMAVSSPQGSRMQLRAQGRWQPADPRHVTDAGRWQAEGLDVEASARRAASAPASGAPPPPWLRARNLRIQLLLGENQQLQGASLDAGRLEVGGAALRWSEASWRAAGPQGVAAGSLDAQLEPLAVAPLLTLLQQPGRRIGGNLMVAGSAKLRLGTAFAADVVLERASGDLTLIDDAGTQAFGLTDLRVGLDANAGTWHFTQAVAGSNVGVLVGAVSLRLPPQATWPAPQTPMQGVLEWQVADLAAWAPFTPPGWRLGGMLRTSAAIGGSFGAPEVTGQMTGSGLVLRNLFEGVDLRDGELLLSLRGDQANVERFVFKGGDGNLQITGGARLGAAPSARLQLAAERFRVLGRFDRRIVATGNATLTLDAQAVALDGKVRIDEGLFDFSRGGAPTLDTDVQVRGGRAAAALAADAAARAPPGAAPAELAAPATPARSVRLALQVDLGDDLKIRGRGLDTRLRGALALTNPGGRLAVSGSVRTDAGNYAAYGQKLTIERGVLVFNGAAENPRLDVIAVRPGMDVRVGVAVSGFAQSPRVRLFSEPEMSDTDKLSWLVLGRAPEGLGRTDTALLQRAALALLAGEGQGLDSTLLANLGLDEFSVRQIESGEVRDTVVTLGKQLSRRWYVGYERGVNSTIGTWQLIYRVAQRFTVRAQAGEDNALDAIWTWRWN